MRIIWENHVTYIRETRTAYYSSVGKPPAKLEVNGMIMLTVDP